MIQDYNKMIETKIEENATGNKAFFIITKELSLNNVEFLRNEMQKTLENCNSFCIQLKAIENYDISAIQLIHAFVSKAKKNKKTVQYEIEISENAKKILLYAGLQEYTTNNIFKLK